MPWGTLRALWLLCCLCACQAAAPREQVEVSGAVLRADTQEHAARLARSFEDLAPRLEALLPDAQLPELSIWVQELPTLYEFPLTTMPEADGFYAPSRQRIHLRRDAPDGERTLAHELTHAALGESWDTLPGTLEEGLCDAVAMHLLPESAARLRAGRYSAALFGLGGLRLVLRLEICAEASQAGSQRRLEARVRLDGEGAIAVDPMSVFEARAGSSATALSASHKKALYGYADLVIARIVRQRGFEGLHLIARTARSKGLSTIPTAWLLAASQLSGEPSSWESALIEELGPMELSELVRTQPNLLADLVGDFLRQHARTLDLQGFRAELSTTLAESQPALDLLSIPVFRHAVLARAAQDRADS